MREAFEVSQMPPAGSAARLFQAVRAEGEHELSRPANSLWWSGVAAGISMSTSLVGTALFVKYLPDAEWSHLVASFGYSIGFLIVVLGRMQLFTENTITTVLPLLHRQDLDCLWATARLWTIVLVANLVGAAIAGALLSRGGLMHPDHVEPMLQVAHHATSTGFQDSFLLAIPAGFLVAAMVWLARLSGAQRFVIIVAITWLIGAGRFAHVVAGSVEVFALIFAEGTHHLWKLWTFTVPALMGNIVGGTGLFALLAYAQVQGELEPQDDEEPEEEDPAESPPLSSAAP